MLDLCWVNFLSPPTFDVGEVKKNFRKRNFVPPPNQKSVASPLGASATGTWRVRWSADSSRSHVKRISRAFAVKRGQLLADEPHWGRALIIIPVECI